MFRNHPVQYPELRSRRSTRTDVFHDNRGYEAFDLRSAGPADRRRFRATIHLSGPTRSGSCASFPATASTVGWTANRQDPLCAAPLGHEQHHLVA
jgi:hypothetical protein